MIRRKIMELKFFVQTVLRSTSSLAALTLIVLPVSSWGQTSASEVATEGAEIIVTGSRIARPELSVANPIVAISAELIENSGKTNLTDIIIRNPALTSSIGGSLAGGADALFGEVGANFLDLRNLGVERTLVLVNGKRHVAGIPNSAAVDVNSIPQDLIEKIDILTGGSSAIYGADGVSGVVNFVLKRNFEGLIARGQSGISGKGDAGTQSGSVTAGTNFANDRGNVAFSYEYSNTKRLSSFARDFSGNPLKNFALLRNRADFPDTLGVPDRILYNNLSWADSAPDGAIDLDLDGIPDFTGSGLAYDRGNPIPSSGGRAQGGSNTPTAGYFGDLYPATKKHSVNLLTSFEFSPAFRFFAEGKYIRTKAFSVGQPSFDFFTFLAPDNAFLNARFGAGAAPKGALLSRDNFDLGIRGESVKRSTQRIVVGFEGVLSENAKYEISYVNGKTRASNMQTSNLIGDRYFAALDAVQDPATGRIVCRSTLDPNGNIDPSNYDRPATTFTTGASSACRPLNFLGNGVASSEALAFVLANNTNRAKVGQQVVSGSISGDFDAIFRLPGGSLGFAVGGEYRRETSLSTPDTLIQNGSLRDFSATPISSGKFDVKEVFAELNAPLLADVPFAKLLSVSAAIRLSDYSTIGKTTTWKVDGIYAPIPDIRFRGTYSQAVRAPNIGELFLPASGTFDFVTDPCDATRVNDGTSFRAANCRTILSGLGLSAAQIAAFSPSTDAQNTTSRAGTTGGNLLLKEETAKTWTAGVVLQPRFIPRLSVTFDWYDIKIKGAVNTPSATELAELCVDQPTVANVFCSNIFRATGTGFVLGDANDLQRRIGFNVRPQNVAAFKTSGADFAINYTTANNDTIGRFTFGLNGGYLKKISFVPSLGAAARDDTLTRYDPRWRGSLTIDWKLGGFSANYGFTYFSKTARFTKEQLAANPDISDPKFFFYKEQAEHDLRLAYEIEGRILFFAGVNNLFDSKPDFQELSYPVSGVGRYFYAGAKVTLDRIFK
jgi:iron complex outermembrane recepter protein